MNSDVRRYNMLVVNYYRWNVPMRYSKLDVTLVLLAILLAGCASTLPGMGVGLDNAHRTIKEAVTSYSMMNEQSSKAISSADPGMNWTTEQYAQSSGKTKERATQQSGKAIEKSAFGTSHSAKTGHDRKSTDASGSEASSPESAKSFQDRIDEFFATLKKAAYAFNPPSPIKVAKPTTIYFLLEPQGDALTLAERIKELAPRDASRIVKGETKWASVMEASLSGSEFVIEPSAPTRKTLNPSERAMWSWVITPKHPGEKLPLMLTAKAILPSDFAPPYEVILLQREINVQVTMWWLFDHYFDKYWKWLLGGAAGLVTALFGWWWKEGRTAPNRVRAGITPALPTPPSRRVRTRRLKQGNENAPTVL